MSNNKPDKERMQQDQQFFHLLGEIIELYPKFSTTQHLCCILRKKDKTGNGKEAYFWNSEELLKVTEQYKDELAGEELMNITDDDK